MFRNYFAEDIFEQIFTENSLNKISKAFFRFKFEALMQQKSFTPK